MTECRGITVQQVKALSSMGNATSLTFYRTSTGWEARCGSLFIQSINSRRPRRFASLDAAVRRLAAEAGITEFFVEAEMVAPSKATGEAAPV